MYGATAVRRTGSKIWAGLQYPYEDVRLPAPARCEHAPVNRCMQMLRSIVGWRGFDIFDSVVKSYSAWEGLGVTSARNEAHVNLGAVIEPCSIHGRAMAEQCSLCKIAATVTLNRSGPMQH